MSPKAVRTAGHQPDERPGSSDPDAAVFVERHLHGIRRWLTALGCDAHAAEDHCQEALLAALHHGVAAWPAQRAWAWLRTTARNLHFMHLRELGRHPSTSFEDAEQAWLRARGDDDGGDAALDALRTCLDQTDNRDRTLLAHRYTEQLSRDAMALAMGVGTAAIKQALRRARARLRTCMEHRLQDAR